MFYLHVSNRTENLVRHLCEVIRMDRQLSLFDTELFLIQSLGMERMVAQTLADEFTCFCNFQFFLPLDFLTGIADKIGLDLTSDGYQRQIMSWRIDSLLRNLDGELDKALGNYLEGENSEVKRFQLSIRLANLFDQYQLMRGDMLAGWQEGRRGTDNPAEQWQLELWQKLLTQQDSGVHRSVLLQNVIDGLQGQEDFSPLLPKRISVFGLHTMPPVYLQFLNGLARHMDVHLFVLSPCKSYWGNIESLKKQYRRAAREKTITAAVDAEEHHPLLASLGQQGRDLQNMMLEHADFSLEFSSYEDPLEGSAYGEATLLQRIQADLLHTEFHKESFAVVQAKDRSVQLVSCHSRIRELMVLKDQLLDLLYKDESLELKDIVVMAPDIQEYAPLIPSVFDGIQYSIADRSVRRRNSVVAAFVSFLELFSGRFGMTEVMDVLQLPVVYPQFELTAADLDTLGKWVGDVGVRWGLSGEHRENTGILSFEESSWRAGLDRMLMGFGIDADSFIDGVLPYSELEGRMAAPLGGLCRFVELLERGYRDFQQLYPVQVWSELLLEYITALFGEEYEQEYVELVALVTELGETIAAYHHEDVSFQVICEWFGRFIKESRSSSGFLRGQLTFCSMLPMRSIPFRVVCLLGLNDGEFPKNDYQDTFDLMGASRVGDRSSRADDRYQFLEAILAARTMLYISFVGQSIKTNEIVPPSVVVEEFIELLANKYSVTDPVVRHPLHPFSAKYFTAGEEAGLFSYDNNFCTIARAFVEELEPPGSWWQGSLESEEEDIPLGNLLDFYKNPPKYFVRNRLGIRLGGAVAHTNDRELFEVSGLDRYRVEQYLLDLISKETTPHCENVEELLKKVQTMGYWPLGTAGGLTFEEKLALVESFWSKVQALELGEMLGDIAVDIRTGPYRLLGTLSGLYEKGLLLVRFGKLRGQDLLTGWVLHMITNHLYPQTQSFLVTTEGCFGFPAMTRSDMDDGEEGEKDQTIRSNGSVKSLKSILDIFKEGNSRALPLYVEPAFVYAKQLASSRGRVPPIEKAWQQAQYSLENGYEPEWELLLGDSENPFVSGSEFEQLVHRVMVPIREAADV